MGFTRFAIVPMLAQQDAASAPASGHSLTPQTQAVYLVLAVTLLLFLLLFVVIGINVFRRIARRREALERLHDPQHRSADAESAWSAAGKRVKPITEPRDPTDPTDPDDPNTLPPRRPPAAPSDPSEDSGGWEDETDLGFDDDDAPGAAS